MARKHKPEDIIGKLREAEIVLAQGGTVADACRRIGVTEQSYYRLFSEMHSHPLKQVRSRALENIGPKRAYVPQHPRCAVERLLPITLEMLGIFLTIPKE